MKAIGVGLVLLLASTVAAGTVDFRADIVKTEGADRVTKGTLHVKGGVYRLEFPDPAGPTAISISDPANDVVRVLVPRYKLYLEGKCSDRMAQSNDPFLLIPTLKQHYETKDAGKETISGYACTKETVGRGEQVAATFWTATKLGFPLRIQMRPDWHVVVSNIREGAVADEVMKVPEGYTKADRKTISDKVAADPEMKAKREAWRANRPRKSRVTKRLTPGAELRILIGKATTVTAGLASRAAECKWHLEAHRGKVLLESNTEPYVGKVDPKTWVGDKLPDLVVVRCVAGAAYFDLTLVGKMPLVLATKQSFAQKPHGGPSWTVRPGVKLTIVRITAEAGEKNHVKGVFELSGGKGKNENRAFTLAPGETKTLECTEQDGWESIGYSIMHGKTQVVVEEDYRAPKDRKPF